MSDDRAPENIEDQPLLEDIIRAAQAYARKFKAPVEVATPYAIYWINAEGQYRFIMK